MTRRSTKKNPNRINLSDYSMTKVNSFPPIIDTNTSLLLLGSMPGEMSLRMQQYYAHPRNAFWSIMSQLLRFPVHWPYEQRTNALLKAGIGVWDVLQECERAGSLDSQIMRGTRMPNAFQSLLIAHPSVTRILFNGNEAATSFARLVAPQLTMPHLHYTKLPSTSPANTMPFEKKLQYWSEAIQFTSG